VYNLFTLCSLKKGVQTDAGGKLAMLQTNRICSSALALSFAFFGLTSLSYAGSFVQTNLVSDIPGLAANTDSQLKNPWGMSFSPTSPFWISDAGTGVSTLYSGLGVKNTGLIVTTPPFGPTGQVFNTTTGFVDGATPATFIFSTLGGTIDAWNTANGSTAQVEATKSGGVYTGLALGGNDLYAADFKGGTIDVYNSTFVPTTLAGNFVDPTLPSGYAPYNVAFLNGNIYVAYAQVDPSTGRAAVGAGLGFVSVFGANGVFSKRLASDSVLNAPWGMTIAPAGFDAFGGDLLVGNFGDGTIHAFDPVSGALIGTITDSLGVPIANPGLWGIGFRTGGAQSTNPLSLYFAAGINGEADGLFGAITPAPEPGTLALGAAALGVIWASKRRIFRA
jgi:uncharacterized protein (TIGR03118 family)